VAWPTVARIPRVADYFTVNLLLIAIAGSDGSRAISNRQSIGNLQLAIGNSDHASLIP
jgi:hypothetical protein